MSDTKTVGQELQGEILKTVRKSQETVVDAIQMWADAVAQNTATAYNDLHATLSALAVGNCPIH